MLRGGGERTLGTSLGKRVKNRCQFVINMAGFQCHAIQNSLDQNKNQTEAVE